MPHARSLLRLLLAAVYAPFGVVHVVAPHGFLAIMPPGIPYAREVVIFTGLCEIAGAIGLLIPKTRRLAAIMLALYAACVWPANIWHALSGVAVPPLPSSWWYHGPRLLILQPLFIWAPLWAAGVIDWPFRRRATV
ncbi:DoxX family protein [Caulobacter sp. FWC2]|uniref:DoxX family protein n=1 Tax=Caulobacter sp. FWC2 TaxID=69664 RepID=UPI000C151043|nr:DoxX family protein [Caulobacter sp. FWC2]PIB93184.1 DoxX family protein [Caulobacter sp. FWC2]